MNLRRLATGLATGAAGALLLTGVAYAVSSTDFTYSTAKTGYFNIAPASLTPVVNGLTFGVGANPAEAESNGCLIAGVHLPDQAQISSVSVYYAANTVGGVTFAFDRDAPATGNAIRLAQGLSNNSNVRSSALLHVQRSLGTVNNRTFSYAFTVCFSDTNQRFYGARVNYSYTSAGD